MSNLFKSGFPGVNTIQAEPFVIDANKRVIEPPKNKIIRPAPKKDEDGFAQGLTATVEEVVPPENEELLGDAMEKAKLIQDDARERANSIIEQAKEMAEQIRTQAYEEAYAKGLEEGNMEAMRRADVYLEQLNREQEQKIEALELEMSESIQQTQYEIVELACDLIEKMTGILVTDYQPVLLYMINRVLSEDEASRKFVIRVSEDKYAYIADNQDRLAGAANPGIKIEIFADAKLSSGQCQIESDTGIVDLSMDVQVRNLITAIKLLSEKNEN